MKKKILITAGIAVLLILLFYTYPLWYLLINPDVHGGFYDPITKTVFCNDEFYCWHEEGHRLDHQKGWISGTEEYKQALEKYLNSYHGEKVKDILDWKANKNLRAKIYMLFSYDAEMYAIIYQVYGGRVEWMPEYLQEFYME